MPRLFVSYRVDDSVHAVIAIADRLAGRFGQHNVFRDRDSLPLGTLYPGKIRRALERSDTVLAMIGPLWLDIRDTSGRRRLDHPRDWVRTELSMAFERDIPVIPVLLDDTPLPRFDQLPPDVGKLSLSSYWQVRHRSFESDVRGLIDALTVASAPDRPSDAREGFGGQHNSSVHGDVFSVQYGNQYFQRPDHDRRAR